MKNQPLLGPILDHASRRPDAVAVIDPAGSILTFGELGRRVEAARGALVSDGMNPGDAVFFAVRPGPDALVLGLAVIGAGGTIVVADPGAGAELFKARAELVETGAAQIWCAAESALHTLTAFRPLRAAARRRGLLLPDFSILDASHHIHTGPRLPGTPRGSTSLRNLTARTPRQHPADDGLPVPVSGHEVPTHEVSDHEPAVVVFTSGTTAAPRGVVHTQTTLAAGCDLIRHRVGWRPGDTVHTDQLMIGLPALASGAAWSLSGLPLNPRRVLRHLGVRRASHLFGTPADIAKLLDAADKYHQKLPASLRCVMMGAAPVPPAILRRLREAAPDAEILSVYGTTEALPIAITTAEEKLAHSTGGDLLGTPLPGVQARIGEDGEILIRGPHLATGYLGHPGDLDGPDSHGGSLGELATGDLGRIDPEGRLILHGRAKDMLIRGSFNLYPGLYEPTITALPGIADAAYVGVPDPLTADEHVVLAVVAAPGQDPAALIRRLTAALPRLIDTAACPDRIVTVAAIPRTGRTAKPDRTALRTLLSTSLSTPAATTTP